MRKSIWFGFFTDLLLPLFVFRLCYTRSDYLPYVGGVLVLGQLWKKWNRHPRERVLVLRETTFPNNNVTAGAASVEKAGHCIAEANAQLDFLLDTLDLAVMKYVGDDGPGGMIQEQEWRHAKLHRQAQRSYRVDRGDAGSRWAWLVWIFDLLLLRCGAAVGTSLCGAIEASSWVLFYYPNIIGSVWDNLMMFHALEEIEHGALSVQALAAKSPLHHRLLAVPISAMLFTVGLMAVVPVLLISKPRLLLSPKTYIELPLFCAIAVALVAGMVWAIVWQWAACVPESHASQANMVGYFERQLKRRGVTWESVKQETYTIC